MIFERIQPKKMSMVIKKDLPNFEFKLKGSKMTFRAVSTFDGLKFEKLDEDLLGNQQYVYCGYQVGEKVLTDGVKQGLKKLYPDMSRPSMCAKCSSDYRITLVGDDLVTEFLKYDAQGAKYYGPFGHKFNQDIFEAVFVEILHALKKVSEVNKK